MNDLALVPSALAESAHPSRTKRYQFLSTRDIVMRLQDRGFTVAHSSESGVRNEDLRGFQRHQVFLDFPQGDGLNFPTQKMQLRLVNSHCGTGALRLYLAVFVLVCSNGLIAPREHHDLFKMRHVRNRFDPEFVHDKALAYALATTTQIAHMERRELTLQEQEQFAHYAIGLRWPDGVRPPFDPLSIIENSIDKLGALEISLLSDFFYGGMLVTQLSFMVVILLLLLFSTPYIIKKIVTIPFQQHKHRSP